MPGKAEVKDSVLTENTAQGVFKYLSELESNRSHMLTRWIWELLQNARDASDGAITCLDAAIEHEQEKLTFLHNGRGFREREIAHLIFHGSTKIEDDTAIGKFGSGFLTTHLLAPKVNVSGRLDDGQWFNFVLERKPGSVDELRESMDSAWDKFVPFAGPFAIEMPQGFSTRFVYPIGSDTADAVKEGIATLKQCAPFVVAFNEEFSSISIKSSDGTTVFKVVERERLEQAGFQRVTVEASEGGNRLEWKYLIVLGNKASIAIPIKYVGDGVECVPVGDTPRLFLGFPLVGTESFSFPAIINGTSFTPTEHRNGVPLGLSDNDSNVQNQAVIEEACDLLVRSLEFAASSGWRKAHMLAEVPDIRERDWLVTDWLRDCLKEKLIKEFRQTPLVLNESAEVVPPRNLELPIAENAEGVLVLWDLLVEWNEDGDLWPRRNEAVGWSNAVKSWAKISDCEASSFNEVMDGKKLASCVDNVSHDANADPRTHRVTLLDGELKPEVSAIDWINRLTGFLLNNGLRDALSEYRVVASQRSFLRTLQNLHRDQGISEELKDIAELLEWQIRAEIRDTRLTSLADEAGAGDWDNVYVVGELIKRLRERAESNPDAKFGEASVSLFAWIVEQENWNLLLDFPAYAAEVDGDNHRVVKLERNPDGELLPLAPTPSWEEDLRQFLEIFPKRNTLADAFFDAAPSSDIWQALVDEGFLRRDVVITKNKYLSTFLPDEPMTEEDHETSEHVTVTDLAFMTRDEIGIMARVRSSQRLARIFWRFLTEWLVINDSKGLEIDEATCDCEQSHRYYPAEWLGPLVKNSWVPVGGDKREKATAQSLANLLRDSEWEPSSLNQNSAAVKLLEVMNVSRFELTRELVSENNENRLALENAFIGMLETAGGNVTHIDYARRYLEDLKSDEDLPTVLEQRRELRRIVHENQNLGKHIEDLVKESLECEGFTVQRTGVGSDFKIEYDDVTRLKLARSDQTWLVEVKATRDNRVRMTDTQARTAVAEGDGFLLCVVPVIGETADLELGDIRDNMRFVENIGPRVDKICNDLNDLKEFRDDITGDESSGIQLEVDSGVARVRVASSVWQDDGFPIADLANRLK